MKHISIGQKKFLAEFLGNFSLAWLVGAIVSPYFSGNPVNTIFMGNLLVGIMNAGWMFMISWKLLRTIKS